MSDASEMTERHVRALAEFSELCLVSARDLAARQLAAEDAAQAAGLASALHKVGRSLRQSIALEARLRRDQEQGVRVAAAEAVKAEEKRHAHRKAQVRLAVERLIWTEARDEDEAEELVEDLFPLLCEEELSDGFCDEPLEELVARVVKALGPIPRAQPAARTPDRRPADPRPPAKNAGAPSTIVWERPPPPIDDDHWRSSG